MGTVSKFYEEGVNLRGIKVLFLNDHPNFAHSSAFWILENNN